MGIQTVVILQECRRVWGLTSKNVFHRRLEEILKKHRSTKSLLVKRLHCEQRFSLQIKSKISLLFLLLYSKQLRIHVLLKFCVYLHV